MSSSYVYKRIKNKKRVQKVNLPTKFENDKKEKKKEKWKRKELNIPNLLFLYHWHFIYIDCKKRVWILTKVFPSIEKVTGASEAAAEDFYDLQRSSKNNTCSVVAYAISQLRFDLITLKLESQAMSHAMSSAFVLVKKAKPWVLD